MKLDFKWTPGGKHSTLPGTAQVEANHFSAEYAY